MKKVNVFERCIESLNQLINLNCDSFKNKRSDYPHVWATESFVQLSHSNRMIHYNQKIVFMGLSQYLSLWSLPLKPKLYTVKRTEFKVYSILYNVWTCTAEWVFVVHCLHLLSQENMNGQKLNSFKVELKTSFNPLTKALISWFSILC